MADRTITQLDTLYKSITGVNDPNPVISVPSELQATIDGIEATYKLANKVNHKYALRTVFNSQTKIASDNDLDGLYQRGKKVSHGYGLYVVSLAPASL